MEYPGIHEMVHSCIQGCDIDIRNELTSSVVVAGSTTMMNGFCQRLHKQIQTLYPPNLRVTLVAPANRQVSTWCGASTITSLKAFDKMWITKKDFVDNEH